MKPRASCSACAFSLAENMDDNFSFPLLVEGQWNPCLPNLKNKLTIYFQSKKSNGGDCCVQHDVSDGQRAIVWFKTELGKLLCCGSNITGLVQLLSMIWNTLCWCLCQHFPPNSKATCSREMSTRTKAWSECLEFVGTTAPRGWDWGGCEGFETREKTTLHWIHGVYHRLMFSVCIFISRNHWVSTVQK